MSDRLKAILMSTLLLAVAAIFFSQALGSGQYVHYDGFHTLERSGGFEKFDDWLTVYSQNAPSARKPPLQYWMTALGMQAGVPELLALRLPSLLFMLGLLAVTAALCYRLTDGNPWAAGGGMLLMVCSKLMVSYGRSGMLDVGMAFFVMLAMLGLLYSRKYRWAWVLCGTAVGLGALQKAPVALLLVTLAILVLALRGDERLGLRSSGFFWSGLGIALVLLLSWPVLQVYRWGPGFIRAAYANEMLKRFSPIPGPESSVDFKGLFVVLRWLWDDTGIFVILAGAAVIAVPLVRRWRSDGFLLALAVISFAVLASYALAAGVIYNRYLIVLLPFLVCVSVKVIDDLLPKRPGVLLAAAALVVLSGGRIHEAMTQIDREERYATMQERVVLLDAYRQERDLVVLDRGLIPPGAYGHFGGSRLPFVTYKSGQKNEFADFRHFRAISRRFGRPLVGMDKEERLHTIGRILGRLETYPASGELVVWRYDPSRDRRARD